MIKIKVTQKQIKEGFKNIISVGYCDLQYLLNYKTPTYYTSGIYGWNSDIYVIDNNTVIVTGYRPFGNISNYKIIRKYEEKAEKITHELYNQSGDKLEHDLNCLLNEFIKEIKEAEA